jgi:hypothetical protein
MLKPIPSFDGYFADDTGNIYCNNSQSGRMKKHTIYPMRKLRPDIHKKHNRVTLFKNGTRNRRMVSDIVLTTFVCPRPIGLLACHGTMGSLDDSVNNLSWQTPKQNSADMRRDGTILIGEKNHLAVLNELQVRIIRRSYEPINNSRHLSFRYIAKIFNVSDHTINDIVKRKTWTHI